MRHLDFSKAFALAGLALALASCSRQSAEILKVYGSIQFQDDCSPLARDVVKQAVEFGRIASHSKAFATCVKDAISPQGAHYGTWAMGPYRACQGEPYATETREVQLARILAVAQSSNDISMNCTGGGGNASASLGEYGHTDSEKFGWGAWLSTTLSTLEQPDRRPAPWPYSEGAGILWHEVTHTHDYSHGGNEQKEAAAACGYASDPTWDYQVNTLPYIVGNCIQYVLEKSADVCGSPDSCGLGALNLISDPGATGSTKSCACVSDPRGVESRRLETSALHAANQRWNFTDGSVTVSTDGGPSLEPSFFSIGAEVLDPAPLRPRFFTDLDHDGVPELWIESEWGLKPVFFESETGLLRSSFHLSFDAGFDGHAWTHTSTALFGIQLAPGHAATGKTTPLANAVFARTDDGIGVLALVDSQGHAGWQSWYRWGSVIQGGYSPRPEDRFENPGTDGSFQVRTALGRWVLRPSANGLVSQPR